MNLPTSEPDRVTPDSTSREPEEHGRDAARAARMKFVYPSGSRPLDGYTIKRGVGRGGFGEVYFATSDAGKEVALKLIRRNLDVELRGVRHCLNLKHPNLIGLYDIRTDDLDDQWVVMEYVSGQSLEEAIEAHPSGMPVADALRWFRGICSGVAYLHDHGIVHRDLKPGNIFLDHDAYSASKPADGSELVGGTVKIGDYGLSKFISCSRRSGQTESVGTVHYMAPEIANGRYGREVDTYALGVILYEMLTGHVPFEGESVGEVLMKHLTAEPDLSGINEPFQQIVRSALAKDPDLRISSVQELVAMLPHEPGAGPIRTASYTTATAGGSTADHERYAGYDDENVPGMSALSHTGRIEEPLFASVRDTLGGLMSSVFNPSVPPFVQGLIVIAVIVAGVATFGLWLPLGFGLAFIYCLYYLAWIALLRPSIASHRRRQVERRPASSSMAPTALHAYTPPPAARRARPRSKPWREVVHDQLGKKTTRDRLTQSLGAMFTSGVLCVLLSALAGLLVTPADGDTTQAMQLWLTIVTTLGCWVVILTNAWTEGRVEDQSPMRMVQIVGGLLVGLAAYSVANQLSLELPADRDFGPGPHHNLLGGLFDAQDAMEAGYKQEAVAPSMLVSVAYFGLLMAIPRWWRLAEFARNRRIGFWAIAGTAIWAWVLHLFWWYPQPLGMVLAATIAVGVQLSNPWLPPSKRAEIARQRVTV